MPTPSQPILRQATRDDIDDIFHVRHSVDENRLTITVLTKDDCIRAIEEIGRGWVIETGGRAVGFSIGLRHTGHLWALFVHPDHERCGYGTRLLDSAVNWLWSQGLESIWLTTEADSRALGFYQRRGWQALGTLDSGEIRLELTRALDMTGRQRQE